MFCSPHLFWCSLKCWFRVFYQFFFNTETVELTGLLEFKFWSILTVFVILCSVHSTRWSSHLIRAKYCLFISFSCVNHLFLPNSLRTTAICIWRFPSEMHNGLAGWYRCREDLEAVLGYWSKNSKLLLSTVWSCHPGLVISVIIQYRSATMTKRYS